MASVPGDRAARGFAIAIWGPEHGALVGVSATGADWWVWAMLAPIVVWSIRLATQTYGHLHKEREPYAAWRRRFGAKWPWWSFFQIHLLQGVMVWIWIASIAFALSTPPPRPISPLVLGVVVWSVGFVLQYLADQQLAVFKRDPSNRDKLLDTGVWSFVRHPNYLGEAIMWWGLFAFALAHPFRLIAIFAPLFATYFMGYASAAPFKERHMARTRPAAWADYSRRTPRFLPWPPPNPGLSTAFKPSLHYRSYGC